MGTPNTNKQSPYCMPLLGYFPDARPYTKHQQTVTLLYASLGILPRRQAIHQTPTNSHLIVCLSGDTSPTPGHTPNTNKQSPYCMPLWGYFPDARPYTKHQQTVTLLSASLGILPRRQAIHQTPTNSHLIVCLSGDTSPTPGHTPNTNKQSPYCLPLWGYFPD